MKIQVNKIFTIPLLSFIGLFTLTASVHAMEEESTKPNKVAAIRFNIQDQMLNQASFAHLKKAGLSEGQTVWEIGCRNGVMTAYLAKVVGKTGHVYAIDSNEEQLKAAEHKIKEEGLENVTFIHGDIRTQKDLPVGQADLVYLRFVLMHDKDPDSLIHAAKKLLKERGVVASQESTMSTSHSSSDNPVFREYVEASVALGKKLGEDYDIGNRLRSLYEQAGDGKTEAYDIQPKVGLDAVKAILPSILEEGQRAVKADIISQEKVANWESTLKNWPENDKDFAYFPAKQTYVLAWKESH